MKSSDTQSIRTPYNGKQSKSNGDTRRILVNGRWQRPDPQASKVLAWLRN